MNGNLSEQAFSDIKKQTKTICIKNQKLRQTQIFTNKQKYQSNNQISTTQKTKLTKYLQFLYEDQIKNIESPFKHFIEDIKKQVSTQNTQSNYPQNINKKHQNIKVSVQQINELNLLTNKKCSQIDKCILQEKQFKKLNYFTQKLIIKKIKHSRHYQVIDLTLHLLDYSLDVSILNKTSQSIIHSKTELWGAGAYGKVYKVDHQTQKYAIKCLCFQKAQSNIEIVNTQKIQFLKSTLKQYFISKLCSTLKIEPKLKQIYGFDMLMFPSCVQFSMEVCSRTNFTQKYTNQLKQKLRILHLLKIVHMDIKPDNILFSENYQFQKNLSQNNLHIVPKQLAHNNRQENNFLVYHNLNFYQKYLSCIDMCQFEFIL